MSKRETDMVVELPAAAVQQLKELRMYHWRQVVAFRAQERRKAEHNLAYGKAEGDSLEPYQRGAAIHMRACQALNDILPGSGEYDCAELDHAIQVSQA